MRLPEHLKTLQTPCLLLRDETFQANVQKMALHCRNQRINLRPHAKTHKSGRVAQVQVQGGAVGICCATLADAEILAEHVDSILITSPVVGDANLVRLCKLQERLTELVCVVDNRNVAKLLASLCDAEHPMKVLLDVDPGMHRTGVEPGNTAVALAVQMHDSPTLQFLGMQCYAGNLMHVHDLSTRRARVEELWGRVATFKTELESRGLPCTTVTGGGTGSYDLDCRSGILTELQAGSYPFMDIEYADIEWASSPRLPFEQSLFVLTTVVSANTTGHATTDAGLKAFATDSVPPKVRKGLETPAEYFFKGDEHGGLLFEDDDYQIDVGTQLLVSPPHCDPTINLYESIHVVDNAYQIVDSYPIDARSGRSIGSV